MNNLIKLITVLANLVILYFIYNLKVSNCGSSKTINREYIFYYSIIHIFLTMLMFLVPPFFNKNKALTVLVKLILGFGMIINVYCLYQFSQELKGVDCSSENFRLFMEYYSYFYIGILVFIHLYLYDFYIKNKSLDEVIRKNTMGNNLINNTNNLINNANNLVNNFVNNNLNNKN